MNTLKPYGQTTPRTDVSRWQELGVPSKVIKEQASWELDRRIAVAYFGGGEAKDIARHLGVTKSVIYVRIHRCIRRKTPPVEKWMRYRDSVPKGRHKVGPKTLMAISMLASGRDWLRV